ncbi:MAG: hypothetical protein NVSMB27_37550 [Ktedonobacteraceae bacterium]
MIQPMFRERGPRTCIGGGLCRLVIPKTLSVVLGAAYSIGL